MTLVGRKGRIVILVGFVNHLHPKHDNGVTPARGGELAVSFAISNLEGLCLSDVEPAISLAHLILFSVLVSGPLSEGFMKKYGE